MPVQRSAVNTGFPGCGAASLPTVREVIVALPLWAIAIALLIFFWLVTIAAREFVLRRRDVGARELLADQANSLLTGVAATFAFFVGFAISVSWGAVTAGQVAVEQQAVAVRQMAWQLNNIADRAESAALMDKLRTYATTVAEQDDNLLVRGKTVDMPSAAPLDAFENALYAHVNSPKAADWQVSTLVSSASNLSSAAAGVAAVASRSLPRPLAALLVIVGVLTSILMGITTVIYSRPSLIFVWCLIPAISITTVLALAYPFALRSGANLEPMRAVVQYLAAA